ncbi:MAG: hypothetical protein WC730_04145 [Patescibacteria group bacterium]|jgi:hypothetical protein
MLEQGQFVTKFLNLFFQSAGGMFSNIPWGTMFEITRALFVLFDLILLAGVIVLYFEGKKLKPVIYKDPYKALGKEKEALRLRDEGLKNQWQKILNKSESAVPQSLSLAIIEADTFVDNILKNNLKLPGEHMADRVDRLSTEDLSTLNRLWRAHRVRNDLVHTPGFYLAPQDARSILGDYEAFLKELEVV